MQAIRYSRFGTPDVLEVVDLPKPVPGEGEVLVRVHAAGINYFEVLMRADRYAMTPDLPVMPGVEVAGMVEALGAGLDAPAIGVRVAVPLFAFGRGGGHADYVTAGAADLVPIPDGLSFDAAVALMVQGQTALHMVRQSPPAGRSVLVTAAAGGVGSLLVQLARQAGAARVIGTASSAEKRALARRLGADAAIDYTADGWPAQAAAAAGESGLGVVYDSVGGAVTAAALRALAPGGELLFAALGRFDLDRQAMHGALERNQAIRGFALLPLLTPQSLQADLAHLFDAAASGALTVIEGVRFALADAAQAHRAIEARSTSGKVLLVP